MIKKIIQFFCRHKDRFEIIRTEKHSEYKFGGELQRPKLRKIVELICRKCRKVLVRETYDKKDWGYELSKKEKFIKD